MPTLSVLCLQRRKTVHFEASEAQGSQPRCKHGRDGQRTRASAVPVEQPRRTGEARAVLRCAPDTTRRGRAKKAPARPPSSTQPVYSCLITLHSAACARQRWAAGRQMGGGKRKGGKGKKAKPLPSPEACCLSCCRLASARAVSPAFFSDGSCCGRHLRGLAHSPQSFTRPANFLPEAGRGVHIAHGHADWIVGSDRRERRGSFGLFSPLCAGAAGVASLLPAPLAPGRAPPPLRPPQPPREGRGTT